LQAGATSVNGALHHGSADWLLTLIAQITGEAPEGSGDELRLAEDLHLDSLGRAQLAAAIAERLNLVPESGLLEQVATLGELRRLLAANPEPDAPQTPSDTQFSTQLPASETRETAIPAQSVSIPQQPGAPGLAFETGEGTIPAPAATYLYPHWPWLLPIRWLRVAFLESMMRPLVWLLAKPAVVANGPLQADEPMLIVANHVTAFDGPLLEYALPGPIRRRMAVAMSGEMLEDYRHFRNPERGPAYGRFFPPGPLFYVLVTGLFNVFPLPRQRDFQRSFAHAGEALDRGFNVLVFPEGARSDSGALARFRPGIGLLVKQSGTAVLPMAMRGLGELKTRRRRWFRSGAIEVRVGQPVRFSPEESEAAITARLHAEVEKLLSAEHHC